MFCNCKNCCSHNKLHYPHDKCSHYFDDAEEYHLCCCCCCSCGQKPICKGRFGLAWIAQTPNNTCCRPCGWQLEFEDSPSKIDQRCQQLIKWVNSPPDSETCNEIEQNCDCVKPLHKYLRPNICDESVKNEEDINTTENCVSSEQNIDQVKKPKDKSTVDATVNTENSISGMKDCGCECNMSDKKNRGGHHHNPEYDNLSPLQKIKKAHEIRDHVIHDTSKSI